MWIKLCANRLGSHLSCMEVDSLINLPAKFSPSAASLIRLIISLPCIIDLYGKRMVGTNDSDHKDGDLPRRPKCRERTTSPLASTLQTSCACLLPYI